MICKYCNAQIEDDSKLCPICGMTLAEEAPVEEKSAASEETEATREAPPETIEETPVPAVEETPAPEEDDDFSFLFAGELEEEEEAPKEKEAVKEPKTKKKPAKKGWILPVVLVLLLILAGFGGFWFYQNQYLQSIDALTVEGESAECRFQ